LGTTIVSGAPNLAAPGVTRTAEQKGGMGETRGICLTFLKCKNSEITLIGNEFDKKVNEAITSKSEGSVPWRLSFYGAENL
jgi:hypothetical protein